MSRSDAAMSGVPSASDASFAPSLSDDEDDDGEDDDDERGEAEDDAEPVSSVKTAPTPSLRSRNCVRSRTCRSAGALPECEQLAFPASPDEAILGDHGPLPSLF